MKEKLSELIEDPRFKLVLNVHPYTLKPNTKVMIFTKSGMEELKDYDPWDIADKDEDGNPTLNVFTTDDEEDEPTPLPVKFVTKEELLNSIYTILNE